MTDQSSYVTEKLILAAYLIASGKADLLSARSSPGNANVSFVLSTIPTRQEITDFFNGVAQVSALRYSEAITNLKSIAHEERRRHG